MHTLKLAVFLLVTFFSNIVFADSYYIAYKWAKPDDKNFTESWNIIDINYSINTQAGMEKLIKKLANIKQCESVSIQYIRELSEEKPTDSTGDFQIMKSYKFLI